MLKSCTYLGAAALMLALGGGCATTGTSKGEMIEDTNSKVDRLVTEMSPAVSKLNETVSTLTANVEENDVNTRKLESKLEEVQYQLDGMKKDFSKFKDVYYRQNNLTPATGTGASGVVIEPPAGAAAPAGVETAPAPMGDADTAALEPITAPSPAPQTAAPAPAPAPAPPATTGNPKELYQAAQQRYMSDDFPAAIKMFDDFIAKYPGDESAANAVFWKGKSQLRLGQYDESASAFLGLTKSYPSSTKVPFALHNAAVAYNKLGRNDEAAKLLQQVIDKYPISPAADQARIDLKKIQGQ